MKNFKIAMAAVLLTGAAHAAEKGFTATGSIWAGYNAVLSPTTAKAYGIGADRVRLGATYGYGNGWSSGVTLDATTGAALVQYAWLNTELGTGNLTVGLHSNAFVKHLEGALGTRWISATVADQGVSGLSYFGNQEMGLSYEMPMGDMFNVAIDVNNGSTPADETFGYGVTLGAKMSDALGFFASFNASTENTTTAALEQDMNWGVGASFKASGLGLVGEVDSHKVGTATGAMAYGVTATYAMDPVSLFANFKMAGNDTAKTAEGVKSAMTFGVFNELTKGVNGGIFYNMESAVVSTANTSSIQAKLAATF